MSEDVITKEIFIAAYEAHPPNKFTSFIYRYFSQSTVESDLKPKKIFGYTLIILFLSGFIGTVTNIPLIYIKIPTFILMGLLVIFAGLTFVAFKSNQRRLKKIASYLGINMVEYEKFRLKYLED